MSLYKQLHDFFYSSFCTPRLEPIAEMSRAADRMAQGYVGYQRRPTPWSVAGFEEEESGSESGVVDPTFSPTLHTLVSGQDRQRKRPAQDLPSAGERPAMEGSSGCWDKSSVDSVTRTGRIVRFASRRHVPQNVSYKCIIRQPLAVDSAIASDADDLTSGPSSPATCTSSAPNEDSTQGPWTRATRQPADRNSRGCRSLANLP